MKNKFYRERRAGKTRSEKSSYGKFLTSSLKFERTEGETIDARKTDGTFCGEDGGQNVGNVGKKSWWLATKDWCHDNLFGSILAALAGAAIIGLFVMCWNFSNSIGTIVAIEKNLNSINKIVSDNFQNISTLKDDFNKFSSSVNERIKYIEREVWRAQD